MEARSLYSRLALQDAFREKLGTTPIAWIREQRLAKAKQQLESHAAPALSIKAVALGCGYRHMGLFCSDFKRRLGSHHRQNGALGEHLHHGEMQRMAPEIHRITTA